MKYQIKSVEFEEFINNFNKYILELEDEIAVMKSIIEKTKWQGGARNAASDSYNKIISEVESIPSKLHLYVDFMVTAVSKYGESNDEIKKSFQDILEKLKIEGKKYEL